MNISKIMNPEPIFEFDLFGFTVPVTESIIMMWIVMAALMILTLVFVRNFKKIPQGKQNVVELLVEFINNLMKSNIGHHWRPFAPYFGTIFLFLVVSNTVSIFSLIPTGEQLYHITGMEAFEHLPEFAITPPTKDLNVTLAMAIMSLLLVLICGIGYKGIKNWMKSFLKPSPIMLPFHIMDYGTRTLTLSLRLFGNIIAGFIIMELLFEGLFFVKPLIPLASGFFDLFDALLQAYIFVFLSSIYISEAIE